MRGKNLPLCQWIEYNLKDYFEERMHIFEKPILLLIRYEDIIYTDNNIFVLFNLYQDAYLQECKQMEINYEKGQTISFSEKTKLN